MALPVWFGIHTLKSSDNILPNTAWSFFSRARARSFSICQNWATCLVAVMILGEPSSESAFFCAAVGGGVADFLVCAVARQNTTKMKMNKQNACTVLLMGLLFGV